MGMIFGQKLLEHRKRNELSAQDLARACGVSRSYVTLIENGRRLPGQKVIPKIAEALNLKANEVLNWYLEDVRLKLQQNIET